MQETSRVPVKKERGLRTIALPKTDGRSNPRN
jgi:hypothetical protein